MPNPFSNQRAKAPVPKRWFWVVMGGLLSIVAVAAYFNNLSVDAKDARRFLRQMPVEQISEVWIEPYPVLSLTDHVIVIQDRQEISRIAAVFRGMPLVSPNHPSANWVGIIRFRLADGQQYGGQIEATKNQGGLFLMAGHVRSGWNYGCYRNDALVPLFEQLVAEEKTRK